MTKTVLVVGGGRVGRHVAEQLSPARTTVTVVEREPEKCEQIANEVSAVVNGDGADTATLEAANVAEADVVAALTNDTETNLQVCERARELAADAKTILRIVHDGEQEYAYRSFVDDTVYPAAAAAAVTAEQIGELSIQ